MFDRDGGGSIEAAEVAQILGHNMSKDKTVWDEIIKEVDLNNDGQIDFAEFKQMMSKFVDWWATKLQRLMRQLSGKCYLPAWIQNQRKMRAKEESHF